MPRLYAAKSESSDGGVDPVGPDDEVISGRRTIREGNVDLVTLLMECCEGRSQPYREVCDPLQQDAMELSTSDADAGADRVPELR
jgi:hypothetical protein